MRWQVLNSVKGMSQQDLDFLLDAKANRIGGLLNHLAAVETLYQRNTVEGVKPKEIPKEFKEKWDVPQKLGDAAREAIKGHSLDFYLNLLNDTREKVLAEFRKRDDKWLMAVDKDWFWGPTTNDCKWAHVTEPEANHNGQIKPLKSRLPGAEPPPSSPSTPSPATSHSPLSLLFFFHVLRTPHHRLRTRPLRSRYQNSDAPRALRL